MYRPVKLLSVEMCVSGKGNLKIRDLNITLFCESTTNSPYPGQFYCHYDFSNKNLQHHTTILIKVLVLIKVVT